MKKIFIFLIIILTTSCRKKITLLGIENKQLRVEIDGSDSTYLITKSITYDALNGKVWIESDNVGGIWIKIKRIDTITTNFQKIDSSLYYSGYKKGQIDALNENICFVKVTQDNGEIIWEDTCKHN